MQETEKKKEKAILVAVAWNRTGVNFDKELEELSSLCYTAGLEEKLVKI